MEPDYEKAVEHLDDALSVVGNSGAAADAIKYARKQVRKLKPAPEVEENNQEDITEDEAKVILENSARDEGIELDRRMSLENMNIDYKEKLLEKESQDPTTPETENSEEESESEATEGAPEEDQEEN